MIYVTADLHGCSPERFQALLDRAGFCDEDFLFILGDVIDRGEHGAELLVWLTQQPNMELILGNHEAMLLACSFLFDPVNEDSLQSLTPQKLRLLENWNRNGAEPTLRGLRKLLKQDPEVLEGVLDYLRDAPLYEWAEAGGRNFLLVHGGLDGYKPGKSMDSYSPHDLYWARPTPETRYSDRFYTVLGHTPTALLDPACAGRAYRTDTWICIDTGCPAYPPMLLRLDDMKEFY